MNILLVTPFHLTGTGGVCTAIRMLYREFRKLGHQVDILVPGESDRVLPVEAAAEACVYGVYLRTPFIRQVPLRGFIAFWVFLPLTLYEMYRFLARKRIDVVAIQYPMPWMFYFAILRWLSTWKLVVTLQGNDAHDLTLMNWVERRLIGLLLVTSDRVTAVSKSLLNEVRQTFPNLPISSCVVPNGTRMDVDTRVSPVDLGNGVPEEYILTVGQLIHRKGIDLLLKALGVARDRGHIMNLVIVGEGPERPTLRKLADEVRLSQHIYFVGNQSHENTLPFFNSCLFFVLASRAEGLPLVILEAMSCNKAVVATNVDGVPELIQDGHTGLLVASEDVQALAEALIQLYKDPEQRRALACRGRQQVLREYSWDAIAPRYLHIFQETMTGNFRSHKM